MRSPRSSVRRDMARKLVNLKQRVDRLRACWDVKTTVYIPIDQREPDEPYLRERQLHEYPENQRMTWAITANEIAELVAQLTAMHAQCVREYNATPEEVSKP